MGRLMVIVGLMAGLVGVAWGEQAADGGDRVYKALGGAAVYSSSPYKGDDSRLLPIPMFVYMSEEFYFYGLEAGYAIAGDREAGVGLYAILSGRTEYYDESDSYIFDGMGSRHASIDGGLRLKVNKGDYELEAGGKGDILGVSNGYEFFGGVSRRFTNVLDCDKLSMRIGGGLSWRSEQLNDYYFGVEDRYATAGRPGYSAGAGLDSNIGVGLSYKISDTCTLQNMINVEFLSSEIDDSPLVDDDVVYSVMVGVVWEI